MRRVLGDNLDNAQNPIAALRNCRQSMDQRRIVKVGLDPLGTQQRARNPFMSDLARLHRGRGVIA